MPRNIEIIQRQFGSDNPLPSIELADNTLKLGGVEAQDYALKEEVNEVADDLSEHESDDVRHLVQSQIDKIDASINSTQAQTIAQSAVNTAKPTIESEAVATAKTYTDSQVASTLTSAKNYADGKDTTTLNSAKSYTDTQIAGIDMSGKEDKSNKVTSMSSSSTDTQYPSAKAVYDAISAIGGGIEELTSPVRIWNLEDGLYKLPEGCIYYYYGEEDTSYPKTMQTSGYIFVISYSTTRKYFFILSGNGSTIPSANYIIKGYSTSTGGSWSSMEIRTDYQTTSNKVNSISSSSTNTQYPSAKAVYDELQTKADTADIPTATSDLTNDSGFLTSQDISGKENTSNKVTSMSSSSTDTQYPSAKAVYDAISAAGGGIEELTSPVTIWRTEDGIYKLPKDCIIYYYGDTTVSYITTNSNCFLSVFSRSTTVKGFVLFDTDNLGTVYLKSGYSKEDSGNVNTVATKNLLTNIMSYVKDNLTYSTSGTTFALSAYQGYLLNQNKADKTEIPTATSDLTNDSDFISSTVITAFWKGTQAQYDALPSYSNTTLYLIEEE